MEAVYPEFINQIIQHLNSVYAIDANRRRHVKRAHYLIQNPDEYLKSTEYDSGITINDLRMFWLCMGGWTLYELFPSICIPRPILGAIIGIPIDEIRIGTIPTIKWRTHHGVGFEAAPFIIEWQKNFPTPLHCQKWLHWARCRVLKEEWRDVDGEEERLKDKVIDLNKSSFSKNKLGVQRLLLAQQVNNNN